EPKPYTITCEFEIADGSRTIVKFYHRPLGVTYNQTLPFTMNVISPGAEGHKRGVQTGWIIRRLRDGEDADWQVMDTEGDFEEANKELVGLIVKLPVAPKDPKT
ncbi:unnamed protein product, partial [Polarella glacialis]